MSKKFKPKDICVIHSKKSQNNNKVVRVIDYTKGDRDDLIMVNPVECFVDYLGINVTNKFMITEDSLELATIYDFIRNMSDEELKKIITLDETKLNFLLPK